MREILFRAKSGNEWVYGDLVHLFGNDNIAIHHAEHEGETRNYIDIIPKTVGQYTGLTDKNGKKIFEGDIVKAECDLYHGENKKERVTHIGTVIYDKKFCQFGINVAGFSKCYVLNRWKGDYNEVIGNIHDNPELLKGGAE